MTSSNDKVVVNPTNGIVYEELTLKIITDKRDTETPVDMIVNQLKELPSIQLANIEELDFSDNEAKKLLEETDLKTLPAFIFSTNTFDVSVDPQQFGQDGQLVPKLNSYLQILPNGEYFLDV
jgi:hypothetical protein